MWKGHHLQTPPQTMPTCYAIPDQPGENPCILCNNASVPFSEYRTPMNKLLCVEEANEEITKVKEHPCDCYFMASLFFQMSDRMHAGL